MFGLMKEALRNAAKGMNTPLAKEISWNTANFREKKEQREKEREIDYSFVCREKELEDQHYRDVCAAYREHERELDRERFLNEPVYLGR